MRVRLWFGLLAVVACVQQRNVTPREPGDRCDDSCPDGMRCWGTTRHRNGQVESLGRCGLEPGRCAIDADCAHGEQCVRPFERLGLCGPSSRP